MLAYQAKDDPALLYNIAQAHRLAGHAQEALRFYRIYLTKSPRAQNRADIELKIGELQKAVEAQTKVQVALPPDQVLRPSEAPPPTVSVKSEPPPLEKRETPEKLDPPPAVAPPVATAPPVNPRAGRRSRAAGISVGAIGVGLIAAGAAMGGLATAASSQLVQLERDGSAYDPALYSTGRTYQALEGALLGVGAAALVTGVVLYALGRRERSRLVLAASGGGAVAGFTW